jgi:hypothetical protein
MTTRTSIPAELKRMVLVEAGHRCAIPTCKNPDVDLHHIVPWETCQKHEFANLIALCPNCHRRAHLLEIDKLSLLKYKNNLTTDSKDSLAANAGEVSSSVRTDWETREIDVNERLGTQIEVRILYPHFLRKNVNFKILNSMLRWEAHKTLMEARINASDELDEEDKNAWWADLASVNSAVFSICVFSETILSFKTSVYWYGAGAAHGHHATIGRNFLLNPLREVTLESVTDGSTLALEAISKFCEQFLKAENASPEQDDWVTRGTQAEWGNFSSFYVTDSGLVICFAPYSVGCFAEGEREVPVSWRFLRRFVPENSLFAQFWDSRYSLVA